MERDGTLTKYGWAWKCNKCGEIKVIASDNVVPLFCSCGGDLINLPNDDVEKFENDFLEKSIRGNMKPKYEPMYTGIRCNKHGTIILVGEGKQFCPKCETKELYIKQSFTDLMQLSYDLADLAAWMLNKAEGFE